MFLSKIPKVKTPTPVIYAAAIFLATFYFWFTQHADEVPSTSGSDVNQR